MPTDPFKNYPSDAYYRELAKTVLPHHEVMNEIRISQPSWHVKGEHYSIRYSIRVGKHRNDSITRQYDSWLDGWHHVWYSNMVLELPPPLIAWDEDWHGPVLVPRGDLLYYINGHKVTMDAWTAHQNGEVL